jgi:predicted short-subunit dehydrogenase-like oxidoreductase (DUF2520 family)
MIRVILIGLGNVGIHLAKAFVASNQIELLQIYNRSKKDTNLFDASIPFTNKIENLYTADVYVIAVSDDVISEFSKQLKFRQGLVVHTSGTVPLKALKCRANKGVFYPLQTFTRKRDIDFANIPIVFEVEEQEDFLLLEKLSQSISKQVFNLNEAQRKYLHIAAVFANNFTNYMYKMAYDICEEHKISFDLIKPLILETAAKVQSIIPLEAQTGPAVRNDKKVIENHLLLLNKNQKEIYTLVTNSIRDAIK